MLAIDSACQMRAFKPWLRADWCMKSVEIDCCATWKLLQLADVDTKPNTNCSVYYAVVSV